MDHKNRLENQSKAYFDVKKQALVVQPLNQYQTFAEQIVDFIKDQIDIYINELKALEVGKNPEQALAMVVFEEGGTSKVEEKKRGRQSKNVIVGSISVSFELPHFCYDNDIDIERILSTRPPKKHNSTKEVHVTPLKDRIFSVRERVRNWRIELSKRDDNQRRDVYSIYLPSNKKFRSKSEVINFILYEASPDANCSKKRKLDEFAVENNAVIGSTSKEPEKKKKNCSTRGKKSCKIPQVMKTEINMTEWFSKENEKNDTYGGSTVKGKFGKLNEQQRKYLEILEDIQMRLSRTIIHEFKEFIDVPIDM